jgi:light-harvesting protein B-800-850 beta chain
MNSPRAGFARKRSFQRRFQMSDPNKVWPTGLTEAESEEIHRHLIQGTQFFGLIAALAHLLAYIYSPWLK